MIDSRDIFTISRKEIGGGNKPKRKTLTPTERIYIWEHPKMYGKECNICSGRITKLSDLELDHTRAHSKGGKKLALAHKLCNRMKGSKSLKAVQKKMGFESTIKKTTKKKSKRKATRQPLDWGIGW